MFTQAGFNHRVRRICFARVSRVGRGGVVMGQLVRWPESGDLAWASRTQISWGEQVAIHSFFYPHVEDWARALRRVSRLPQREMGAA